MQKFGRLSKALNLPLRATIYDEGGGSTFKVASKPEAVNQAYGGARRTPHPDA